VVRVTLLLPRVYVQKDGSVCPGETIHGDDPRFTLGRTIK
jgi:hypothetical protein